METTKLREESLDDIENVEGSLRDYVELLEEKYINLSKEHEATLKFVKNFRNSLNWRITNGIADKASPGERGFLKGRIRRINNFLDKMGMSD